MRGHVLVDRRGPPPAWPQGAKYAQARRRGRMAPTTLRPLRRTTCAACLRTPLPRSRGGVKYCDECYEAFLRSDRVCGSCSRAIPVKGRTLMCHWCGTVWGGRREGAPKSSGRLLRVEFGSPLAASRLSGDVGDTGEAGVGLRPARAGVAPGICAGCGQPVESAPGRGWPRKKYCNECNGKRYNAKIAEIRWRKAGSRKSCNRAVRTHEFDCRVCGKRTVREFTMRRPVTCWRCLGARGAASRNRATRRSRASKRVGDPAAASPMP